MIKHNKNNNLTFRVNDTFHGDTALRVIRVTPPLGGDTDTASRRGF